MDEQVQIDYGPLAGLIGVWQGGKGLDIAPEPEGAEENPYYETITFQPAGDVTNAETQTLVALHYRQIVSRQSNNKVFHDETGYWMWDASTGVIMHGFVIPRAVSVMAGGRYDGAQGEEGEVVLEVAAGAEDPEWQIIQSPFMAKHARTLEFRHKIVVADGRLSYTETTMVDIYGKVFEHTDQNALSRV